jgi:hypothetical protein
MGSQFLVPHFERDFQTVAFVSVLLVNIIIQCVVTYLPVLGPLITFIVTSRTEMEMLIALYFVIALAGVCSLALYRMRNLTWRL